MDDVGTASVVLRMNKISKRFGRLLANDNISLMLGSGEVLALLGENGAGKTTLMSILFGSYVADRGTIEAFGKPLASGSNKAALDAGIGMVQQHFALADNHTVLENIVIGTEPLFGLRRRRAAARTKIRALADKCGFEVSLDAQIQNLSVGERQKVEILKVLYRDARILVLDEPTAVLTPQEAEVLFATIRRLVAEGMSVILISHKLEEVLRVSDRIMVLRDGRATFSTVAAQASKEDLVAAMVGRSIERKKRSSSQPGKQLLHLDSIVLSGSDEKLSLTLCANEIIGITGVAGNGQAQLAQMLNGLQKPASGTVEWLGVKAYPQPDQMQHLGVARIPDDRHQTGVVGDMTVAENMISAERGKFSKFGFLQRSRIRSNADELMQQFDVRCDSADIEARLLSGGNMQKLICARELSGAPQIIIASQPGRGLDVGAVSEIHRMLLEAKERGAGVLLITEDLDELFALADRVAVMYKGKLSEFQVASSVDIQHIGRMMSGVRHEA